METLADQAYDVSGKFAGTDPALLACGAVNASGTATPNPRSFCSPVMKELLIVRHALAHERDASRWPDDEQRPLSLAGRRKFRRFAALAGSWVPAPDVVLCSPLRRARQTARILRRRANFPKAKKTSSLRPETPTQMLIKELGARSEKCVVIVGHEPALSRLVVRLLGWNRQATRWRIKKGAIVWLSFKSSVRAGNASLVAYLPTRLAGRR
jgi:phosphohistidine phosphatase